MILSGFFDTSFFGSSAEATAAPASADIASKRDSIPRLCMLDSLEGFGCCGRTRTMLAQPGDRSPALVGAPLAGLRNAAVAGSASAADAWVTPRVHSLPLRQIRWPFPLPGSFQGECRRAFTSEPRVIWASDE